MNDPFTIRELKAILQSIGESEGEDIPVFIQDAEGKTAPLTSLLMANDMRSLPKEHWKLICQNVQPQ